MEAAVLEAEALKLSEEDRALLIDHLQQSLSSSRIAYLEEHLAEAHSRFDAYKKGEMKAVDGREVVSNLKAKLRK